MIIYILASNEAEEAVASSLFCAITRARIAMSYKTSAYMHKVNYITVTDLTCTINRDLMVGKRPAAYDNDFLYKAWKERQLIFCRYFVHLRTFNKMRPV